MERKIVIGTRDGKKVTAAMYDDKNSRVAETQASCHDDAEFDFFTGARLALHRLEKKVKAQEEAESMASKWTNSYQEELIRWHEFRDGYIRVLCKIKEIKNFVIICNYRRMYYDSSITGIDLEKLIYDHSKADIFIVYFNNKMNTLTIVPYYGRLSTSFLDHWCQGFFHEDAINAVKNMPYIEFLTFDTTKEDES